MKKFKLIFAFLAISFAISSCENDGGDSNLNLDKGAVPDIQKIEASDQSINLLAVTEGTAIDLGFSVGIGVGESSFKSIDVLAFYIRADGTINKFVLDSGVTSLPKEYHLTFADLVNMFPVLNGPDDIELTDQLLISSTITLKNGTVIQLTKDDGSQNYGIDTANSPLFSITQKYIVSCPLDDASAFTGDYTVVTDDWADYAPGEIIPVEYNPDVDGLYSFRVLSTNNPYISNPDTSYMLVTIDPATSQVTVLSNEEFMYGGSDNFLVTGTGSVGSCTGSVDLILFFGPNGPYNMSLTKN